MEPHSLSNFDLVTPNVQGLTFFVVLVKSHLINYCHAFGCNAEIDEEGPFHKSFDPQKFRAI